MDLRDSKSRLILIVLALGIVLVVIVAGCGGGSDDGGDDPGTADGASSGRSDKGDGDSNGDGDGDQDTDGEGDPAGEPQILAQVTGEADITLTVVRASREEGGFLTVEGTLHNGGSKWRANAWRGPETELADNGFSMAGATITAKSEGKKYLILRDTAGRCLCTIFDLHIESGETVNWFAQFPAPDPATTEVDFQIGQLPPATFEIN